MIEFQTGLTGTLSLLDSGLPEITQNLFINGPGSSSVTVTGRGVHRVFKIGSHLTVEIGGLTITNGSTSGNGGGILAGSDTTLIVSNSTISSNTGSFGGGIENKKGLVLSISDSLITGNQARSGGGIDAYGSIEILNSVISNNTATEQGGGVFVNGNASLSVSDSTFSSNRTLFGGGIVLLSPSSQAIITDSNFSGNIATSTGGAVYNKIGTLILNANKFGVAVTNGIANTANSLLNNVNNLNGNTGMGNDPDTCNANTGNC